MHFIAQNYSHCIINPCICIKNMNVYSEKNMIMQEFAILDLPVESK